MNICPNRLSALAWASLPMGSTTVTLPNNLGSLYQLSWAPRGLHLYGNFPRYSVICCEHWSLYCFLYSYLDLALCICLGAQIFFPWKNTQYPEATERQCQATSVPQILVFPGHSFWPLLWDLCSQGPTQFVRATADFRGAWNPCWVGSENVSWA